MTTEILRQMVYRGGGAPGGAVLLCMHCLHAPMVQRLMVGRGFFVGGCRKAAEGRGRAAAVASPAQHRALWFASRHGGAGSEVVRQLKLVVYDEVHYLRWVPPSFHAASPQLLPGCCRALLMGLWLSGVPGRHRAPSPLVPPPPLACRDKERGVVWRKATPFVPPALSYSLKYPSPPSCPPSRDKERGVVWEESIILAPRGVRFAFLSATVSAGLTAALPRCGCRRR